MFHNLSLYRPILFFSLIIRIFFIISRASWFTIWAIIEFNLLVFIPLILKNGSSLETEGIIKYFLIQATRSVLIIILFISNYFIHSIPSFLNLLFIFIILIKLGAAPCHLWFPQVINCLSWLNCLLLSTFQKIIPLSIFLNLLKINNINIMIIIIISNRIVGAWGGFNQSQIRPLIAYSSIGHLRWILASSFLSLSLSILYFTVYIILSAIIISSFNLFNTKRTSNFNIFKFLSNSSTLSSTLNILSLGGLPPLLGFFPKWLIIIKIFPILPIFTLILISGSLINLYYYIIIIINIILTSFKSNLNLKIFLAPTFLLNIIGGTILTLIYAMTLFYKP